MQDEVNFHWLFDITLALQGHQINILILKTIYSWCIDITSVSARILTKIGEWGAFWQCIDQHICSLPEKYKEFPALHSLFQGLVGGMEQARSVSDAGDKWKVQEGYDGTECRVLPALLNNQVKYLQKWLEVTGNEPQEMPCFSISFLFKSFLHPVPLPSPPTQLHVAVFPTCTLFQWGWVWLATCILPLIPISKTS